MTAFEEYVKTHPGVEKCPTITEDKFVQMEYEERQRLEALDLPEEQKQAIRRGLDAYPGSGVLEVIAHMLTKTNWFKNPPEIKLDQELREEMAREADHCGEGMYSAKKLLEKSDVEIAEAYLDAMRAYVESQVGY
jgi:hypothetical protein